jgi:hypothetical protein
VPESKTPASRGQRVLSILVVGATHSCGATKSDIHR